MDSCHHPSIKDSYAVPGHHILTVISCPTLRGATRIQYISPQKEIHKSIEHAKKLYQQYA